MRRTVESQATQTMDPSKLEFSRNCKLGNRKAWTNRGEPSRGPLQRPPDLLDHLATEWTWEKEGGSRSAGPPLGQNCRYDYFLPSTLVIISRLWGGSTQCGGQRKLCGVSSLFPPRVGPEVRPRSPGLQDKHFYQSHFLCLEPNPTPNRKLRVCVCHTNKLKLAQPMAW